MEVKTITIPPDISLIGNSASLWGPHSFNIAGKNNWHYYTNNFSNVYEIIGTGTDNYTGIKILIPGEYRAEVYQRGNNDSLGSYYSNNYVVLTKDGDRGALENRTDGVWTHDHSGGNQQQSHSLYIGHLDAGEIISGGYKTGSKGSWGDAKYGGILVITRISP